MLYFGCLGCSVVLYALDFNQLMEAVSLHVIWTRSDGLVCIRVTSCHSLFFVSCRGSSFFYCERCQRLSQLTLCWQGTWCMKGSPGVVLGNCTGLMSSKLGTGFVLDWRYVFNTDKGAEAHFALRSRKRRGCSRFSLYPWYCCIPGYETFSILMNTISLKCCSTVFSETVRSSFHLPA